MGITFDHIKSVQITFRKLVFGWQLGIFIAAFVLIVIIPQVCYNDVESNIRRVIMIETVLAIMQMMLQSKVWCETGLYVFVNFSLNMVIGLFTKEVGVNSDVISIIIATIIQSGICTPLFFAPKRYKDVERHRFDKICTVICPVLLGAVLSTMLLNYLGFYTLPSVSKAWNIFLIVAACFVVALNYVSLLPLRQHQLLLKYKDDPILARVMKTYQDGSVYIRCTVSDQSICDFIDYRIFVPRYSKRAQLPQADGVWYSIRKEYYEKWLEQTTVIPPIKVKPKRKKRKGVPL